MPRQVININTDANIILTAKLERLNRSAFPSAVRSTLNDGAFEMKRKNILESAKRNMTVRNLSFFRKFTGVKRATGFRIDSMYSEVGFINTDPNPIKGKKAIEGMELNEVGGIDNTGSMYMKKTRIGSSRNRLVRKKSRFNKDNIVNGKNKSKNSKKQSFVRNAYASLNEKSPTFIETKSGRFLVQVRKITNDKGHKKIDIKMDFLMRSRRKNPAKAKATHFNKEAAIKTSKKMDDFYYKNAMYQFKKALNR